MRTLALMALFFFACNSYAAQKVVLYVYHLKAPYIVDNSEQSGLYYDVSTIFNRFQNDIVFTTYFVPRKRLDKMVEAGQLDGLVLGVNPIWFKDTQQEKYLWSEALFNDVDDFVSSKKKPFEYENQGSLLGKTLGGILGYRYFGVDELVDQGQVTRVNTNEEHHLLDMLIKERLDVAIVSRSTREYLENLNTWQGLFHVSDVPHDRYSRHIMGQKSQQLVMNEVNRLLSQEAVRQALSTQQAFYQSSNIN